MKKVSFKKLVALMAAVVVCFFVMRDAVVYATSTADKLNQVQQNKKSNENKLDETTDSIQSLKQEKDGLRGYLEKLDTELEAATAELTNIESLIAEKEELIKQTSEELEEAKELEKVQYEAMKTRIRFMYENSQNFYWELLVSSDSFVNFLNQTQYIERLTNYDREMLETYQELQETIARNEQVLQEEREGLVVLSEEATLKRDSITALVAETHQNMEDFMDEIAQKEKEALELEEKIRKQSLEAADLQEQLNEEIALSRLAAASASADISGMEFSSSDLDMMAAIIECEAGGESYTGKVAVGAVVMNRVRSSLFPNTIAGVIYQNKQFSPVGSGRFAIVLARGANESCYEAAREAMSGVSPVGNCVFFRTPIPGLTGIQIGGHIFY